MTRGHTICALATASGGALGLVRLSGPEALAILRRCCDRRQFEPWRQYLLRLCDPDEAEPLDEVLACYMAAPRSYTGEDVVEVSAHGGELNLQQVVELFVRLGARAAEAGEFTRRAFLNGRIDLTQAEAVAEVIAARGKRALRNARAVLDGALGRRVRQIRGAAIALMAEVEAAIDFAEEDDPGSWDARRIDQKRRLGQLKRELERLRGTYQTGRRLGGVAVALTGAVNAGKSSLFNALLDAERALVSPQAGTTRDYLEAEVSWDGVPVTLVDLAGWRNRPGGELEREGVRLGKQRQQRCDLVVEVVDLADATAECVVSEAQLVVGNKVDLLTEVETQERVRELQHKHVVVVSAKRATGLVALRKAALEKLLQSPGAQFESEETVQVTSERHASWLACAAEGVAGTEAALEERPPEIVAEHLREVLDALGEITGERYTEAVLDEVFSRFCIGK